VLNAYNNKFTCDQVLAVERNVFYLLATLGVFNSILNPIIYAARYHVFKRYLMHKLCTPPAHWDYTCFSPETAANNEKKKKYTKTRTI